MRHWTRWMRRGQVLATKPMPDPYIREKFTRRIVAAREQAREYFERYASRFLLPSREQR
jgi:hypothetical protein